VCVGSICRSRCAILGTRHGGTLVTRGRFVFHGGSRRPIGTLIVLFRGSVAWVKLEEKAIEGCRGRGKRTSAGGKRKKSKVEVRDSIHKTILK
jgi:hypothetical protein